MIQYIESFYLYILPIMALLSFGYIIYLLLAKETDFYLMEEHFYNSVKRIEKLSEKAIRTHFENVEHYTGQVLKALDQDAREQLEQTHSKLQDINKTQQAISYQLQELQRANAQQADEIKKRDAIIERKTKQLQRLKDGV
jgi:MFS superfamily sulfate permease-like transporter